VFKLGLPEGDEEGCIEGDELEPEIGAAETHSCPSALLLEKTKLEPPTVACTMT
jgi:hypothetical protein